MTHGIDTDFVVAVEISDHPFHKSADRLLRRLLAEGHEFALVPQTLAEFLHVVTDSRRMPVPLTMSNALARANDWWNAAETVRVFPDGQSTADFLEWVGRHQLGRRRLLDTQLAATLHGAGVRRLITNNGADYLIFGAFEIVPFRD